MSPACPVPIAETVSDAFFREVSSILREPSAECSGFRSCLATKRMMSFIGLEEAVSLTMHRAGLSPFLSRVDCANLFPRCVAMK